jgi:hypothetical protein
MSTFNRWLSTFLSEKEIDLEEGFEVTGPTGITNYMHYGNVVDAIKSTSAREQILIQRKMVRLITSMVTSVSICGIWRKLSPSKGKVKCLAQELELAIRFASRAPIFMGK